MTRESGKWLSDFRRLLPVRSGFVIRGRHLDKAMPRNKSLSGLSTNAEELEQVIGDVGLNLVATYDVVSGLRVHALQGGEGALGEFAKALGVPANGSGNSLEPQQFAERIFDLEIAQSKRDPGSRFRYAVVVEYGSRLLDHADAQRALAALLKRCDRAQAVAPMGPAIYCPLVMWVDNIEAVPSWFLTSSQRTEPLTVTSLTIDQRREAVQQLSPRMEKLKDMPDPERTRFLEELTVRSTSLSLTDLDDMTRLGRSSEIKSADELVRSYQLGDASLQNPWKSGLLRERIAKAEKEIEGEVLGQPQAVTKAVDILKRSVVGLSGAQASSSPNRPRGVLFFAGPTGTGKTELAKQIAKVVFGDPEADLIRFDMSEYSSEHHEARLVGAPPGYRGFEAGGQLTDAVRTRPFSVILFDEIEKANPRILDKFLQILEDGRITDGRGQTAYFSESILIFTSNLGMSRLDRNSGERTPVVHPGMPYEEIESAVRGQIEWEFREGMGRPELLNRFGDNIVVFNFIGEDVGERILAKSCRNLVARVRNELDLELKLSGKAQSVLTQACLKDLRNGGRGIGMKLETVLINPLARALVAGDFTKTVTVEEITQDPATKLYSVVAR